MQKAYLLLLYLLWTSCIYSQDKILACDAKAVLAENASIQLYDKPNGKIAEKLKSIDEKRWLFELKKKKGNMYYVIASHITPPYRPKKGWIYVDSPLLTGVWCYKPILFYSKPTKKSKVVLDPSLYYDGNLSSLKFKVLDCKGKWLKVKVIRSYGTFLGWLAPDVQCPN